MKGKKENKGQKKNPKRIHRIICFGLFIFFSVIGSSRGDDWTILPWGLNLAELNQAFKDKFKTGQIKEDKDRSEFEFQYAPAKSFKVRKGKVAALLISTEPSSPGHLYGYAFEGKIFGRVILYNDHPEFFPETLIRKLKEQYPQGKIIQNFSSSRIISFFEYKSNHLYIFSTDRGVFYYEPNVLEKVVRIELELFTQEEQKFEEKNKNQDVNIQ